MNITEVSFKNQHVLVTMLNKEIKKVSFKDLHNYNVLSKNKQIASLIALLEKH